jgi:hypothetical protein
LALLGFARIGRRLRLSSRPGATTDRDGRRFGELIDLFPVEVAAAADDLFDGELAAELTLEEEDVLSLFRRQPLPLDRQSNDQQVAFRRHKESEGAGRDRTGVCRFCKPMPYHLATAPYVGRSTKPRSADVKPLRL